MEPSLGRTPALDNYINSVAVAKRTSLSNNMYFLGRKDVNLELRRVAWHVIPDMKNASSCCRKEKRSYVHSDNELPSRHWLGSAQDKLLMFLKYGAGTTFCSNVLFLTGPFDVYVSRELRSKDARFGKT